MRHFVLHLLLATALVAGCTSGNDEGETSATTTSAPEAAPGTTAADDGSPPVREPGSGQVDVGLITTLPAVDLDWDRLVLEPAQPEPSETRLAGVAVVDGQYVAVAFGWTPFPGHQVVDAWRSSDGERWEPSRLEIPVGQSMQRVVVAGDLLLAMGDRPTAQSYIPLVYRWDGAGGWEPIGLETAGVDLEGVEFAGAATTEAGIVLGGRRDRYEPGPRPVTFQVDELVFEIGGFNDSYAITDVESGQQLLAGRLSEIYRHADEGQAVYDLETGQLLTVVPWDVWESSARPVSPLPIPIPDTTDVDPARATIEWDGYEITRDEEQDSFTVVDQASGDLVTSGPLADLYQGPAPAFFDPDSGELLIRFSWDEWWALIEQALASADEPHGTHLAEQVVLFSADGARWSEQILEAAPNTHLDAVLALDGRFVVSVVEHRESSAIRRVYVSDDGVDWTSAASDGPESLYEARAGRSGAIALGDLHGNSALFTSARGLSWSTALFLPPQRDGRHGWLRHAAAGDLARAAVATIDPGPTSELLEITVGSRTARFGGPESAVTISDEPSGDVLLELSWAQVERAMEGVDPPFATYADGATTFYSGDGTTVMTITDDEAWAAFERQEAAWRAGVDHPLFIELDGAWYEAALPDLGPAVPEQLAVGSDEVLVGTNTYDTSDEGDGAGGELGLLVGRIQGDRPATR